MTASMDIDNDVNTMVEALQKLIQIPDAEFQKRVVSIGDTTPKETRSKSLRSRATSRQAIIVHRALRKLVEKEPRGVADQILAQPIRDTPRTSLQPVTVQDIAIVFKMDKTGRLVDEHCNAQALPKQLSQGKVSVAVDGPKGRLLTGSVAVPKLDLRVIFSLGGFAPYEQRRLLLRTKVADVVSKVMATRLGSDDVGRNLRDVRLRIEELQAKGMVGRLPSEQFRAWVQQVSMSQRKCNVKSAGKNE